MGEGVVAPLQALMKSARPVKSKTRSDLLDSVLSPFRTHQHNVSPPPASNGSACLVYLSTSGR
jgi:hypothetical protein